MFRHGIQQFSQEERLQFNALKKRVADAAFKKEIDYPLYKKIKVFRRNKSQKTLFLKSGKTQSGIKIIRPIPIQKSPIENLDQIIESFILELTCKIWQFKNDPTINRGVKPSNKIIVIHINKVKEYLKDMGFRRKYRKEALQILEQYLEKDNNINSSKELLNWINMKHIDKVEEYLKHVGFRRNALKEAIQILEQDLIDREKQVLKSQDFKSFFKTDPNSTTWKHHENDVITKIKSLYKRESKQNNGSIETISIFNCDLLSHPWLLNKDGTSKLQKLSDREIISNMAFIFAKTNSWDDQPTNKEITEDVKSLNSMNEEQLNELKYEKRLELYFDRIKKRLQKDKELNEMLGDEISPPPKNLNKSTSNFFLKFCKQLLLTFQNFLKWLID